jgi:hypothetical protein
MPIGIGSLVRVSGVQSCPEINGRTGIVVAEPGSGRWGVQVEGRKDPLSLRQERLEEVAGDEEAAFLFHVRNTAPSSLHACVQDLVAGQLPRGPENRNYQHWHMEYIAKWASDADVRRVLADNDLLKSLAAKLATLTMTLGELCEDLGPATLILPCLGCNTCCDQTPSGSGHHHDHPELPPRVPVDPRQRRLIDAACLALKLMALTVSLLLWPQPEEEDAPHAAGQHRLLDYLVPEVPAGVDIMRFAMDEFAAGRPPAIAMLVGAADNCAIPLPKCAHAAVSVVSIIVSRRPAAALRLLDPQPTCAMLAKYLDKILTQVCEVDCLVEERFGTVNLINCIPVLYHLGDWSDASHHLDRAGLPPLLARLSINLLHNLHYNRDENGVSLCDNPANLDQFPELIHARVDVDSLFGEAGARLMRARPSTFAMACLVEVQVGV